MMWGELVAAAAGDWLREMSDRMFTEREHSGALQARRRSMKQTQSTAKAMKRPLEATVDLAFPHGVLHSLPKRQALEKSNGASALFNPSVLHYQQALANAQFQQPTAFFPAVPMMHSATSATVSAATTPATSVPFAATATANQIILK